MKHPLIEVLEGKIVSPVPVAPIYPGVLWFPSGLFIRFRFFELLYKQIQESGYSEKVMSSEEILEIEFEAISDIVQEVTVLPTWLGTAFIPETKIPSETITGSRVFLRDDGFIWRARDGKELLRAKKNVSGNSWEPPPLEEACNVGSWENIERDLISLKKRVADLKSGHQQRSAINWRSRYESGALKLFQKLKEHYGNSLVFVQGLDPPFPAGYQWLGDNFYAALLMMLRIDPEVVHDLLEMFLPRREQNWDFLQMAGIETIFLQEYITGAEVVNPSLYAENIVPYTKRAVEFFKKIGFKVILYFCGKVMPVLDILKEIPFDGLMVEESRKGYNNDIGEVRRVMGPKVPLFGNFDIQLLESGSETQILNEVQRQIKVAGNGAPFILSTGSPLTQATTREKVRLFYESPHLLTK